MRQSFQKKDFHDRALIFLTHLPPYKQDMGAIQINHKLGFHKAMISRDIQNLVTNGFLTQNSQTKKWLLGSSQRLMSNKDIPLTKESMMTRHYV